MMRKTVLGLLVVILNALIVVGAAGADTSLRCGNTVVAIGDTMYSVRQACGPPVSEQRVGERTTYTILDDQSLKIKESLYITEWLYNKDSGTYILTFEGSRLIDKTFER